jgi:hypothetical protein
MRGVNYRGGRAVRATEQLRRDRRTGTRRGRRCGRVDRYRQRGRSELAHPIATQILAPTDKEKTERQKDVFFSWGCPFFTGAVSCIETQLIPPT